VDDIPLSRKKKTEFSPPRESQSIVDDIPEYGKQKKYFKTGKGKSALKKARKRYDRKDPERRRKQKRDYMRRIREREKYGEERA
jgi:hypothetical protein